MVTENISDTYSWPRISIVTPSYNQGPFLEETILSVIGSHYPNLEYIIMDGGSTDNSIEIIKKYETHLAYWASEKDSGQSDAINKGFSRATGSIYGWLNSDDMYLPGALHYAALNMDITKPEYLFGNCFHFKENKPDSYGSDVKGWSERFDLSLRDYTIQPASFWTQKAWVITGGLDINLHYSMDWDWVIRAKKENVIFKPQDKYLAVYRIHENHKTSTGKDKRLKELSLVYRKHRGAGYERIFLECCGRLSTIHLIRRLIHRFRLGRYDIELLRYFFPKLFWHSSRSEIISMLDMTK